MDAAEQPPPLPFPSAQEAGVSPESAIPPPLPATAAPHRRTGMLCPYCGHFSEHKKECDRCRGLFEPLSRQASQNAMGPWFIRDEANPFRPGCSYSTMRMLVSRKRIVPESVLRGPSTRQFWTFAKNTPGIAHLLGECHVCHKSVDPGATKCPHCAVSFAVEEDRQYLGLAEVRLIPGQTHPSAIAKAAGPALSRLSPQSTYTGPDASGAIPLEPAEATDGLATPAIAALAPEHPTAYEPIRNAGRPPRDQADLSDAQIDALLRRGGGGSERAERGTKLVAVLIVLALVGVVVVLFVAVSIAGSSLARRPAAGATAPPPPTSSGSNAPAGPTKTPAGTQNP